MNQWKHTPLYEKVGVHMKSRKLPENVFVELCQKTFMSPLYKQIANFESAKLGRFG